MEALKGDLFIGRWPVDGANRSPGICIRRQKDPQAALFVFGRQEHSLAHLSPELGMLEVGYHHDGQSLQLVQLVVADDSRHNLSLFGAEIDIHDQ